MSERKKWRVTISSISLCGFNCHNALTILRTTSDSTILSVNDAIETLHRIIVLESDTAPVLAEGVIGEVVEIE